MTDANGLPVINRPEGFSQTPYFPVSQFLLQQPMAEQQGKFMSMLSHSSLGPWAKTRAMDGKQL